MLEKKPLQFEEIHIMKNGSDIITKPLPKEKLKSCIQRVDLMVPPHDLEEKIYWIYLI